MSAAHRLWLLLSPALPVGGFSYSQGLEQRVACGAMTSAADVRRWVQGLAHHTLAWVDLPILLRMWQCAELSDADGQARWNARLLACRDTAELRREDREMGRALARLLDGLAGGDEPEPALAEPSFAASFARACRLWGVPRREALTGYAWVWCENQIAAAVKLVPLGQTAGQGLLLELADDLDELADSAESCADDEIGRTAMGLFLASAGHETMQSGRLFRS